MTDSRRSRKTIGSARRADRYAARSVLWERSSLDRVKACGLRRAGHVENISVRVTRSEDGNRAGFAGVQSCGSVWACPVCSEKIQAHRNSELADALAEAKRRGWQVGFLTSTVRHRRGHSLTGVWGAVSTAWRTATSGSRAAWEEDRWAYGIVGYVRLVEVTHGANGWHVHVHALVFFDPAAARVADLNDDGRLHMRDFEEFAAGWQARWAKGCKSAGRGYAPSKRHGTDFRLVGDGQELAAYFAKNVYAVKTIESAAADVTMSHTKTQKHGNTTPFGILARIVKAREVLNEETGELVRTPADSDLALWAEWERVSKGKRQLVWSNGLRADLLAGEEATDEEVAAEEHGGRDVVLLDPAHYRRLARRGFLAAVLDAAEVDDNGHALCELLRSQHVPWELPPPGA